MSDVLLRALHALFFANVVSFEKPAAPEQSFFTAVRARLPGSRLAAGGARGWGAAVWSTSRYSTYSFFFGFPGLNKP